MKIKWLTVIEASRYLKMGKSTVYRLAQEGRLPAHKIGRQWRFDVKELDTWLRSGKLALRQPKDVIKKPHNHYSTDERGEPW